MQPNRNSRIGGRSPNGVGLALVALPRFSVGKRPVGEPFERLTAIRFDLFGPELVEGRRPYTPLHRYG